MNAMIDRLWSWDGLAAATAAGNLALALRMVRDGYEFWWIFAAMALFSALLIEGECND